MNGFYCILDENKECVNCMECQLCDINPGKTCDNCGACIDSDADYRAIDVDGVKDGIIEEE